jgi:rubrerythrin
MDRHRRDIDILNRDIEGEYFGIAAYDAAIGSGLLSDGVADVARAFRRDHQAHAERLSEAVRSLGGQPPTALDPEAYRAQMPALESQEGILRYAITLERAAASAHLAAVSELTNREAAGLEASISGNEAMHWSVLLGALNENPVPVSFVPGPDDVEAAEEAGR